MHKEDFIYFRRSNAGKKEFNDYCNKHGLEEQKAEIDKVNTLNKVPPSLDFLQVASHYNQKCNNIISNFSFSQ